MQKGKQKRSNASSCWQNFCAALRRTQMIPLR